MRHGRIRRRDVGDVQRRDRDHGQAAVELALAMPVVVILLLGVVQVAVIVRDQLAAIEAAHNGARAASVAAEPTAAGSAAATASAGQSRPRVTVKANGSVVGVSVTITNHTDVPIIGALLPDVDLHGSATMLFEPP